MDSKTFVVHVVIQKQEEMPVHSKKRAQIQDKALVGALLFNEAPIEIPAEYSDDSNIFLAENVAELLENIGINKHVIKLEEGKQPSFGLIYCLDLVK